MSRLRLIPALRRVNLLLTFINESDPMGEVELAALLCAFLGGSEAETRQYFDTYEMKRHVRVDCETDRHVIEVALDSTSSARDSVHQALFAAHLTGKDPAVIMIDRDGFVGRFEYEMRPVTQAAGVTYIRCAQDVILRWAATSGMRDRPRDFQIDDIPTAGNSVTLCDLRVLGAESSAPLF